MPIFNLSTVASLPVTDVNRVPSKYTSYLVTVEPPDVGAVHVAVMEFPETADLVKVTADGSAAGVEDTERLSVSPAVLLALTLKS